MKKSEIKIGGVYVAKVSNKLVNVRVNSIEAVPSYGDRTMTRYGVTNLATGRQLSFRSGLRRTLAMCGKYADGKHLPPEAFTLPQKQAEALLSGYLSGDGHYLESRNRWMASSTSKPLLLGLAMLAQRAYGAIASVYAGRPPGETTIEGRVVPTKQDWIFCFDIPDGKRKKGLPFILDDGAWLKVRSVEPAGEVETWNLRVEEDESFTAEGCIVKNCPLQFDIVNRLINQLSNPGDVVFDPFGGLMTVPYCAIKLKRFGMGVELNTGYWRDGTRYCRAAEGNRTVPTLFDALEAEEVPA